MIKWYTVFQTQIHTQRRKKEEAWDREGDRTKENYSTHSERRHFHHFGQSKHYKSSEK